MRQLIKKHSKRIYLKMAMLLSFVIVLSLFSCSKDNESQEVEQDDIELIITQNYWYCEEDQKTVSVLFKEDNTCYYSNEGFRYEYDGETHSFCLDKGKKGTWRIEDNSVIIVSWEDTTETHYLIQSLSNSRLCLITTNSTLFLNNKKFKNDMTKYMGESWELVTDNSHSYYAFYDNGEYYCFQRHKDGHYKSEIVRAIKGHWVNGVANEMIFVGIDSIASAQIIEESFYFQSMEEVDFSNMSEFSNMDIFINNPDIKETSFDVKKEVEDLLYSEKVFKDLNTPEKMFGRANFEAIFFRNGSYDQTKLSKIGNTHIATVRNYDTPKNIYIKIVGTYGSDRIKDNRTENSNSIRGSYELGNDKMGISLIGNYTADEDGYYATMTVTFGDGVSEIKFYKPEYLPDIIPVDN